MDCDEWYQAALRNHQEGNLQAAADLYARVLEQAPNHPGANYYLAMLHLQHGMLDGAVRLFRRLLDAMPDHIDGLVHLGRTLALQGKADEAVACFERVLAHEPDHVHALFHRAATRREQGDHDTAIAGFRRVLVLDPNLAEAHVNLANALFDAGSLDEAFQHCFRALESNPNLAIAHQTEGVLHQARGDLESALPCYRRALELAPDLADAHANLATALASLGRLEEAEPLARRALELAPDDYASRLALGRVLRYAGRHGEAIGALRGALERRPNATDALDALGDCLRATGHLEEAIECFRTSLRHRPDDLFAVRNLADALLAQDEMDEARECFTAAAQRQPDNRVWAVRSAFVCPTVFEDDAAIDRFRAGLERSADGFRDEGFRSDFAMLVAGGCQPPFGLHHLGRDERALKESIGALFAPSFPDEDPPLGSGPPKVGFVVTEGREGPFVRHFVGLFDHFTPNAFHPTIVCSIGGAARIRPRVGNQNVEFLSLPPGLADSRRRVGEAGFDLLFHWEVGSDAVNYFLPFCRLAPIQCASWAVPSTSGIPAIDYYLSSAWFEADGAEAHYSETLKPLRTLLRYEPRRPMPSRRRERGDFRLPTDGPVYLCGGDLRKFHPDFDAVLANLLRADPAGTVVIVAGEPLPVVDRLKQRFARGMADVAERITFLPKLGRDDYSSLLLLCDVLLDPWRYGDVDAAYDGFSYGKAIVTLPTTHQRGRYAKGCYDLMDIGDCVAATADDYVRIAVELAADRGRREELEARIRAASEPLFENPDAAAELERFFLTAYEAAR